MGAAGMPGTGLGGLLYLLLALAMPGVEGYRTLRGRGDGHRWRQAWTQFAMACGVLAATAGTVVLFLLLSRSVHAPAPSGPELLLAPGVLAAFLLATLTSVLRAWAWCSPEPPRHRA